MVRIKYKHIIAFGLIGFAIQMLGALFKITHARHADIFLTISFWIIIIAIVVLIIKLLKDKGQFLNR